MVQCTETYKRRRSFSGERGLAFSGSSHRIDDPNNSNFLDLIELISRLDPMQQEHAQNVKEYHVKMNAFKFIIYLQSSKTNLFHHILAI